jgi:nitrogen-specific signal transduction histidine kinase
MSVSEPDFQQQVVRFKEGIREIAHELNNSLGVLRTASYLIEAANENEAKRKHYLSLMNASLDRMEAGLKKLKALRENPTADIPPKPPEKL